MTHKFFFGQEIDLTNIQSISDPYLSNSHTYFKNNPYSGVYYITITLMNGIKVDYRLPKEYSLIDINNLLEKDKDAWRRYVNNKNI